VVERGQGPPRNAVACIASPRWEWPQDAQLNQLPAADHHVWACGSPAKPDATPRFDAP
jgi:hypothetical protein